MLVRRLVRCVFLLLAVLFPSFAFAQFQEPTSEELKMTADPKAPGAAAVFLNVEEIANDPIHYQSFYARIKVLAEKGKELATVEIPYMKGNYQITDIKGRTIHPDGTIVPLAGKPEDLLISQTVNKDGEKTQFSRKVFTLPSVEVGSILEYVYQVRYDDDNFSSPTWEIQRPYFVHKAHYMFTPFKGFLPGIQNATSRYLEDEHERVLNTLIWVPRLPAGVAPIKADAMGRYIVDLTDIPPIPEEEWMPPVQSFKYSVRFYYKSSGNPAAFWTDDGKLWSKDVDHFAEPSKTIREAVSGLILPGDSELDKAKKLYKAVQALDNTDFSRKKSDSERKQLNLKKVKRAEDTWTQKSGSSEEIALLYLAMLRSAGMTAYAMKVVDRVKSTFDVNYLSFYQLDNTVVILSTGGKEIFLDPGEKMCPFQKISWRHAGAGGMRESAEGRVLGVSPLEAYPENKTLNIGDVIVDGQGAVTGSFRFLMTGQQALYWRQLALTNDQDEVKKQFDHSIESLFPTGVEGHVESFKALDDPDQNLIAYVKAQGVLGTATAKRLLLPAFFFNTRLGHPFVAQEKRLEFVDMHYGEIETGQVTYHLPAGFTVESAPQDGKIAWPDHEVLATKTVPAPGQITIVRSLSRAFTFAKPDEYQELHGFYQKVAASDQQQLVLTVSPAVKGN